jgi:general secretion pathway protein D
VLNNREFAAIDSVHIGESAVLVTALTRQESDSITGIPGLSEIPGFRDGTSKSTNLDYSRLAIVITPHIVRSVHPREDQKMVLISHHP